jgi:hypothetical protein
VITWCLLALAWGLFVVIAGLKLLLIFSVWEQDAGLRRAD